jgi:asparagine synthase (glutamine-hydrolysing)
MCGLVGKVAFDADGLVTPALMKRMCDTLAHRGPDDEGYYVNGRIGLGHRRLAIVDLRSGRQPIPNEDRSVWVALNGEIYNYVELRDDLVRRGHRFTTATDTEVIVHLYEERGEDFVNALRGMFAIALWDGRSNVLLLVRDRVGKKPLYYSVLGARGLAFASEIRALVVDPEVERRIDPEAVDAFLSVEYVPAPLTIYKSIRKLPPGHLLRCSATGVSLREYWDLPITDEPAASGAPWHDELAGLLTEAVRVRLRSDVPLGAFLSGGIDSSTVVAFMAELLPRAVVACTATFEEAEHDERMQAREVAVRLGCDHRERLVKPDVRDLLGRLVKAFDEPFADPAAIPSYLLAEAAREHVKVALTGDGGDELFAGYWRHGRQDLERRLRRAFGPIATSVVPALAPWLAPAGRRAGLAPLGMAASQAYAWKHSGLLFAPALKRRLYTDGFAETCRDFDPSERFRRYYERCPSTDPLSRALYVDFKTSLPDGILVKVDRTSMAHGIEIRSPLLDQTVVEFAARVPSLFKLRGGRGKHVLAQAAAGRVPDAVLARPKHGMTTPIAQWIRREWREVAEDCLLGRAALQRGLFEPRFVESLWRTHLSGRDLYAHHLWTLITLELWHRHQTG